MITKIDFSEAKALLDTVPDIVMLDVREEEEYATGHAVGAELLPVDSINAETVAALIPNKKTPILLYCRTGRRSAIAAHTLASLGYTALYDIGGLSGWPYGIVG